DVAVCFQQPYQATPANVFVFKGPTGAIWAQMGGGTWAGGVVHDVGDLNGDGRPELAIYRQVYDVSAGGTIPTGASLYTLPPPDLSNWGWITTPTAVGDVDNDGISDLAVVSGGAYYNGEEYASV